MANVSSATESGYTVTMKITPTTLLNNFVTGDTVLISSMGGASGAGYDGTYQLTNAVTSGGITTEIMYTDPTKGLGSSSGGTVSGADNFYAGGQDHFTAAAGATLPAAATGTTAGGTTTQGTTYYVKVAYVGSGSDLPASIETAQVISAGNLLTVTPPPSVPGETGWKVYVGVFDGTTISLHLQQTFTSFGSIWTEPTSGITTTGVSPPATNFGFLDLESNGIHVDKHAIVIDPNPNAGAGNIPFTVVIGNDGGVYGVTPSPNLTNDTVTNYNGNTTAGLYLAQFYGIAYNPTNTTSHILGGVQDNGIINQTGGLQWGQQSNGDGGQIYATSGGYYYDINFDDDNLFSYGNLTTSNPILGSGSTGLPGFRQVPGLFPNPFFLPSPNNPQSDPTANHTLWFGTDTLYMTADASSTGTPAWYTISNTSEGWFTPADAIYNNITVDTTLVDSMGASAANSSVLYVAARGGEVLVTHNLPSDPSNPANDPTWKASYPVPIITTQLTTLTANTITVQNAAGFPSTGTLFIQSSSGVTYAVS